MSVNHLYILDDILFPTMKYQNVLEADYPLKVKMLHIGILEPSFHFSPTITLPPIFVITPLTLKGPLPPVDTKF